MRHSSAELLLNFSLLHSFALWNSGKQLNERRDNRAPASWLEIARAARHSPAPSLDSGAFDDVIGTMLCDSTSSLDLWS
jgi:hypothetical protein